jgi:hypothetical protein
VRAAASATTSSAQRPLDHVLDTLRTSGQHADRDAKILISAPGSATAAPSAGGLVGAAAAARADSAACSVTSMLALGANELTKLWQAGARIERIHMARGLVQAWVDPSALQALAGFSWVRAIRSVDRAVARTGSITTQGDAASRADVLRARASTAPASLSVSSRTASTASPLRRRRATSAT